MPTIIYLHGFASAGVSAKSNRLVEEFGADNVLRPDLPIDPDQTVALVTSLVHAAKDYPIVFVGTSLGGFWANYFAQKFDAPCILVNPSVDPELTMKARVGQQLTNYKTGAVINITDDIVEKFKRYKAEASDLYNGALVNLFLAKNDELLDYRSAETALKYCNSCSITEDGGHRYNSKWSSVVGKIKSLVEQ